MTIGHSTVPSAKQWTIPSPVESQQLIAPPVGSTVKVVSIQGRWLAAATVTQVLRTQLDQSLSPQDERA